VDVHDEMIETCIIKGLGDEKEFIRKRFGTNPEDLKAFAEHLSNNDCYHIAMESTGVFWRPVYESIEKYCRYVEGIVVTNAAHMRNLPGRKADADDAEWISTLLQHGLLRSSFVPPRAFRDMREASRLYKKFVGEKSRYTNRIIKLLQAHGIKLSLVLADILCMSGRNILNALAEKGSLSEADVKNCLKGTLKHSPAEIHASVSNSLEPAECAMLVLLLRKIETAESDMQEIVSLMLRLAEPYQKALEQLDSIPGIDTVAALLLLAEISATPHLYFSSPEKLCSWAGLSPRNDESAGKVKSRKILPGNPYVKSILCQAAWAAVRCRNSPFRDWFWTHRGKLGDKKAIIAVSRKMLTVIYRLLESGDLFNPNHSKSA